uniref:Uncharacterized protein n=1 Tax=Anguilla anguilla TaxID=7936 RepID=A0A0E9WTG7_ANGAN
MYGINLEKDALKHILAALQINQSFRSVAVARAILLQINSPASHPKTQKPCRKSAIIYISVKFQKLRYHYDRRNSIIPLCRQEVVYLHTVNCQHRS